MSKKDDCSIDADTAASIRAHAKRCLVDADAIGAFPTRVKDIMERASLVVSDEDVLNEGFIMRLRRQLGYAGTVLKRAVEKVIGILDASARLIYIDRSLMLVKQTFVKLHETAHAVLPWQKSLYRMVEDCNKTIAPEITEQFEREANAFASEVLFQLDGFTEEANDFDFGILVPVRLSKKYGSSIYSAIRRYVSHGHRACAVFVLDPPVLKSGVGFTSSLRRVITSPSFDGLFGKRKWREEYSTDDRIGSMIPIGGRRMSRPQTIAFADRNGTRHECVAEAFTQSHQVFILIHAVAALDRRIFVVRA